MCSLYLLRLLRLPRPPRHPRLHNLALESSLRVSIGSLTLEICFGVLCFSFTLNLALESFFGDFNGSLALVSCFRVLLLSLIWESWESFLGVFGVLAVLLAQTAPYPNVLCYYCTSSVDPVLSIYCNKITGQQGMDLKYKCNCPSENK